MPNYLLKCFYWKKYWIESYPTDLISLSQAERSDFYRIRNLCQIMKFLLETDPYPIPISRRYDKIVLMET